MLAPCYPPFLRSFRSADRCVCRRETEYWFRSVGSGVESGCRSANKVHRLRRSRAGMKLGQRGRRRRREVRCGVPVARQGVGSGGAVRKSARRRSGACPCVLDVRRSLAGDDGQDPTATRLVAVGVGVVALVTEQSFEPAAGPAGAARNGRDPVDQGEGGADTGPSPVDRRLLPPVQATPAGLPRAEGQLRGQELPGYVVVEDEQDTLEAEPVRHRSWPWGPLRPRKQQRLDQRPQLTVHDPRSSMGSVDDSNPAPAANHEEFVAPLIATKTAHDRKVPTDAHSCDVDHEGDPSDQRIAGFTSSGESPPEPSFENVSASVRCDEG